MTDKKADIIIGTETSLDQYQYDYEISKSLIGFSSTRTNAPINGILTLIPIEQTIEPCPAPSIPIQPTVEQLKEEETIVPATIPSKSEASESDPSVFEELAN